MHKIEYWHMAGGWVVIIDGNAAPNDDMGPYIFKTSAHIRAFFFRCFGK